MGTHGHTCTPKDVDTRAHGYVHTETHTYTDTGMHRYTDTHAHTVHVYRDAHAETFEFSFQTGFIL